MSLKELKPVSLQGENIDAIISSFEEVYLPLHQQIFRILIYPRIDEIQDESLLDILAWQFHLEGYELAETIEEKRALIKRAIELHRYKGTPWAVKEVLKALGINSVLKEWFEYQGNPYFFKVYIINKSIRSSAEYQKYISYINAYKNTRSWLDSIGTYNELSGDIYTGAVVWQGCRYTIDINIPDIYVSPAIYNIGITYRFGSHISIGV